MRQRLGGIPAPLILGLQFVQQGQLVVPGQLCKHRLHKLGVRPGLGKGPHVLQVARREALHVRECHPQVMRQPLDDLGTPTLGRLTSQDVAADLPLQQHQFAVHRQRRALLCGVDAGLQLGQPLGIVRRRSGQRGRWSSRHAKHRLVMTCGDCRPRHMAARLPAETFVQPHAPHARPGHNEADTRAKPSPAPMRVWGVKANLMYFTRGRKTERIWYYNLSHITRWARRRR